jgi:hypothetical protein
MDLDLIGAQCTFWRGNMSKRRQWPDPDRRRFLKDASLAGAAAALAPSVALMPGAAPRAPVKAAPP